MISEGESNQPKTAPPPDVQYIFQAICAKGLAKMIARWHLALLQTFMSPPDKPVHLVITDKQLF